MIPPELIASRTVVFRQLMKHIGEETADNIKTELETKNTWLKIDKIIKLNNITHMIKVVTKDTTSADKLLENGCLLFNTSICTYQLEKEIYVNILMCYKCYGLNKHLTKDCTSQQLICSECANIGHTYR